MIDVIRKNCAADAQTKFEFHTSAVAFRVKNFTDDKILVSLGDSWNGDQSVRINANMCETLVSNPDPMHGLVRSTADTVIVYAVSAGEVEVMRDD